jgi:hypothetical protein
MTTRHAGTVRSWVLRASVGAAAAVLAGCGSTSHGDDASTSVPGSRPSACTAPPTQAAGAADATEPTTPRGLACALLAHVPAARGAKLSGDKTDASVSAAVDFDDASISSYFIVAYGPDDPDPLTENCSRPDSGYRLVVCRTNPDGARVAIMRAEPRSLRGRSPRLIGRASRPDGTSLLLEVFTGPTQFPKEVALRVLSDPAVGWHTTRDANRDGLLLTHYSKMHIEVKVE